MRSTSAGFQALTMSRREWGSLRMAERPRLGHLLAARDFAHERRRLVEKLHHARLEALGQELLRWARVHHGLRALIGPMAHEIQDHVRLGDLSTAHHEHALEAAGGGGALDGDHVWRQARLALAWDGRRDRVGSILLAHWSGVILSGIWKRLAIRETCCFPFGVAKRVRDSPEGGGNAVADVIYFLFQQTAQMEIAVRVLGDEARREASDEIAHRAPTQVVHRIHLIDVLQAAVLDRYSLLDLTGADILGARVCALARVAARLVAQEVDAGCTSRSGRESGAEVVIGLYTYYPLLFLIAGERQNEGNTRPR